ncbi:MAG: PspC domain-containing protein [Flammeovirgaceae bacterium]|nr:MAG: PspC domain-containing protein [Flammeovirgaceae bacterium]
MKKNISINISGIIFHIEEDGYEALKKYLDSVNKYFSSFDDSSEILADIESRIAEIFLSKLSESKQVITSEDVKNLIATMGSVHDFKAAEEQDFVQPDSGTTNSGQQSYSSQTDKKFLRDQKRKILGGVCAGLGNYFNVDPVWIRLLFAFLTLAYGVILLVYLVLWIVIPGSYDLDEPQITKKLFRDPERKVLGGVSAGMAAYFGMDVVIVRILFIILTVFGGLGIVTYIVLWIVLPEAKSITDKMQMQGEPVTLSNIESNIKKGSDAQRSEENAFTKILLFPFRLLGMLITGLGKILTPIAEVLRVAIGILIAFTGLILVIGVLVAFGIFLGLFTFQSAWLLGWQDISFPIEEFSRAIPTFTVAVAFIGSLIPGIIILLLGISAIANRVVFNAATGWFLFILFLSSVVVLSATVPKIVMSFKEDGEHKVETVYDLQGKTAVLKIRETGLDDYDVTTLSLKGYEGKTFKLVQYFEAQGRTRQEAANNAQMINYTVQQQDSVLTFDSNIQFSNGAVFRAQRLKMTLYIPYNYPFVLDDNTWRLLSQYIEYENRNGNTWLITTDGWLKCITCESKSEETPFPQDSSATDQYGLEDFSELELNGLLDVTITRGNTYAVEWIGRDTEKEKYKIYTRGSTLIIDYDDEKRINWRRNPLKLEQMNIRITMPELERMEVSGAGKVRFKDFTEDDLELDASGAVEIRGEANVRDLRVNLNGASELILQGEGTSLDARISGASQLSAFDFRVRDADIRTSGASKAKVHVTGRLEMNEGIASKITYKGNPEVIKD